MGLIHPSFRVGLNLYSCVWLGLERAGFGWTRPYGCLDAIQDGLGWLKREYSREIRVGLVRRNLADGAAPVGLSGTRAGTTNGVSFPMVPVPEIPPPRPTPATAAFSSGPI
jgi:hypothetical protein